jgi:hypothetical protein
MTGSTCPHGRRGDAAERGSLCYKRAMPRPQPFDHARAQDFLARMAGFRTAMKRRRRRRRKDEGGEGGELVPVEPDKPRPLSGGAAVELEFDD